MYKISSVFSLLFIILMFVYIYWGISIFRLNKEERLSKMFAIICLAASIWSLGFAMANIAQTSEQSLFWRRVAAIGWSSIYSVVLHFFLLIVNEEVSLRQKKMFTIIYVPAFINMYIFSFSNAMAAIQYNMIKTDYGWINKPVNNIWDYQAYFYAIVYVLSILIIAWKWKEKEKNIEITKQRNFFLRVFVVAFLIGSLIDVILNSIFKNSFPQISPLFALFPIGAMYKLAKHDDLIKLGKTAKDEIIVTGQEQTDIFKYISIAFFIGGLLSFYSGYFSYKTGMGSDLKFSAINACILISISLVLIIVQNIKKESLKEKFNVLILSLSVPIVALRFLDYGSITLWGFPIIIMMSALLFTKKNLLVSVTIMSIITQRLIWIFKPEVLVRVNAYDYVLRIVGFVVVYVIGSYVNKTYLAKIKENKYQMELQKINSEISFELMTVNKENFNEKVKRVLSRVGLFFKVHKAYLLLINDEDDTILYFNEWTSKRITKKENVMKKSQ